MNEPTMGHDEATLLLKERRFIRQRLTKVEQRLRELGVCPESLYDHDCDADEPHTLHRAENAGEGGADLVWSSKPDSVQDVTR